MKLKTIKPNPRGKKGRNQAPKRPIPTPTTAVLGRSAASIVNIQRTLGNRVVQRFLERPCPPKPSDDLGERIEKSSGQGQELDEATRRRLEGSLGAKLPDVRIHADAEADRLCRSIAARAFTSGRDIFFREGEVQPGTSEGLRLLAHEATHAIQQTSGPVDGSFHDGLMISDPGDRFERSADAAAERAVAGTVAGGARALETVATPPAVQRQEAEDKDASESPWGSLAASSLDLAASLSEAGGQEGIAKVLDLAGKGVESGGALAEGNYLDTALSLGAAIPVVGGAFSTTKDLKEGLETGDPTKLIKGGVDFSKLTAGLGGFNLAEAGGLSVLGTGEGTLAGAAATGELGTMGLLGPYAAVAASGLAGYEIGKGLDKGVGSVMNATGLGGKIDTMRGISRPQGQHGDYSISGMSADLMTAADQSLSSLWADPSKPAYTQTLGWKLANWLD